MLKLNLLLCASSHFNSDAGRQARRAWAATQFDFTAWGGEQNNDFHGKTLQSTETDCKFQGPPALTERGPKSPELQTKWWKFNCFHVDGSATSVVPRNKQQAKNYQGFQHTDTHTVVFKSDSTFGQQRQRRRQKLESQAWSPDPSVPLLGYKRRR